LFAASYTATCLSRLRSRLLLLASEHLEVHRSASVVWLTVDVEPGRLKRESEEPLDLGLVRERATALAVDDPMAIALPLLAMRLPAGPGEWLPVSGNTDAIRLPLHFTPEPERAGPIELPAPEGW
jgi:hypothetical protein